MTSSTSTSHCSSGCPTPGFHRSYGECLRSKSLRIAYCASAKNQDFTNQKKWDRNLDHFHSLVDQGIQPDNTWPSACEKADRLSQETGQAYVSQT